MKEKILFPVLQKPILGMEILSVFVALCGLNNANDTRGIITILCCGIVRCALMVYYVYGMGYQMQGLGELYTVLPFAEKKKEELMVFSWEKGLWIRSGVIMGIVSAFGMPQYIWLELGFLFLCFLLQKVQFSCLSKKPLCNFDLFAEVMLCFVEFFLLFFGCFLQAIAWKLEVEGMSGLHIGQIVFLLAAGVGYLVTRKLAKKAMCEGKGGSI